MNKKRLYFLTVVWCFMAAVYGLQKWQASYCWADLQPQEGNSLFENTPSACTPPYDLGAIDIWTNEVTIYWNDLSGNMWEYYVVPQGDPAPSAFITTSGKEQRITQDASGTNIQPDTPYEFYVRTSCGTDGTSNWIGPYQFRTACTSFVIPFWEGFNTDSPSINCWTIVDNDSDGSKWEATKISPYEGDKVIGFDGVSWDSSTDDWLISPKIKLDGTKTYQLRYHYKVRLFSDINLKVLLSKDGITLSDFTTVLLDEEVDESDEFWREEKKLIGGVSGDVHFAWQVTSKQMMPQLLLDNVFLVEIDCAYPEDLKVKNAKSDQATLVWKDNFNADWEYIVQKEGEGYPMGTGTSSTTKEVTVTTDKSGNNLIDNTEYEFYVRSKCPNGYFSDWIGPFVFRTLCKVFTPPFVEGFNTTSPTKSCWTIVDVDKDGVFLNFLGVIDPIATWGIKTNPVLAYEGDSAMQFRMVRTQQPSDDWLISPAIEMTGGIYAVSYYLRTQDQYDFDYRELEVLLSENGIALSEFKTVLLPKKAYDQGYKKQTLYVQGITGEVNIAWHATSTAGIMMIDLVTIEAVDCMGIKDEEIIVSDIKPNQATFTWQDDINTQWEYYVKPASGTKPPAPPTGSGAKISGKNVTVSQTAVGANLQPDTEYEFWVRSNCSNGIGLWVLADFKTLCNTQPFPFWEGFNTNSTTVSCWTITDVDGDVNITSGVYNKWAVDQNFYEGDRGVSFWGRETDSLKKQHDDWLISPTFVLDPAKYYRLKYHYQTNLNFGNEFAVLLSTQGVDPVDFTHELISKQTYSDDNWNQKIIIFSGNGLAGEVNIGWHITTEGSTGGVTIDNVFLEEVDCPEPFDLQTKDEKENSAVLFWTEDLGANWEYIVQKADGSVPAGSGMKSAVKEVTVTTDKDGKPLEPNTEYEFYVRTDCGNGKYSTWTGPYPFRTACKVFDTPFWEGFNVGTPSIPCWTVVNENKDLPYYSRYDNYWHESSVAYEGSGSMRFYGTTTLAARLPHNDWLISPAIKFEAGKTYRLKYHYQTISQEKLGAGAPMRSEFEVLLSQAGLDIDQFTTTVVPRKKYNPGEKWKEEYVFISGVSGELNLAWHVVTDSLDSVILYIDNVFVEEVQGCPEPLPVTLGVKDEQSDSAVIFWEDDRGGTQWEYYIQEAGNGIPTGIGTQANTKENIITNEQSGKALEPNTTYEFYVRTVCGNGEYSIWTGPYEFTTLCGTYTTPFWEDFNTNFETLPPCWEIRDQNGDATSPTGANIWRISSTIVSGRPQKDQYMEYFSSSLGTTHDDWLISPTIAMDAVLYVLKYKYYTPNITNYNSSFEVLLSSVGTDPAKFTTIIVPTKIYQEGVWKEEIVYFTGVASDINLGWHVNFRDQTNIRLDDVSLKKAGPCPEPYDVTVTNQTSNSIDIEWQQDDGITTWEVFVVDYGKDETATPVQTVTVTGNPTTTINGLDEGKAYTIYVRAKCTDGYSYSHWSTPMHSGTVVSNDDCDGAIGIPVNTGNTCDQEIEALFIAATESIAPKPACFPAGLKDIWFEFTATAEEHFLEMEGGYSKASFSFVYVALYDQPCHMVTTEQQCFYIYNVRETERLENLVPGQKYYIRMATTLNDDVFNFKLCLTTPKYLEVSPEGEEYTLEELVKDVLTTDSKCDLVSNISYQNADGNPQAMADQTIGYFNKNGVDFPFEEGIVIATGDIQQVPGPLTFSSSLTKGVPPSRYYWEGDKDVNEAIAKAGPKLDEGSSYLMDKRRTTQLEFDFIPIKDSVSFEYLFASNHYSVVNQNRTHVGAGAVFAAWLTDTKTQARQNLAQIPGTDIPVATNTIRDKNKMSFINSRITDFDSSYPELYWKTYDSNKTHYLDQGNIHRSIEAPFNFEGSTIALSSKKVAVIPGRKYHLKLLVIDACPGHSSAVFINAKSLDLGAMGDINLGEDLLIATNTAICPGELAVIQSGIATSEELYTEIEWYKDDVLIPGANTPDLEVSEAGEYKVVMKFTELNCEFTDSIKVEVYPPISQSVHQAKDIIVCRQALEEVVVNLISVETEMFKDVKRSDYTTEYYKTIEEAETAENAILNVENYTLGKKPQTQTLYIRVENTVTGCNEVFELHIQPGEGAVPDSLENVRVCAEYIFPATANNQYYYTESGGEGKAYKTGDVLAEPGEHTIYLLQINSDEGCYEETSYKVNITAPVTADIFEDQTLSCEYYELPPLSEYNSYYTEPEGQGTALYEGMQIIHKQIVYIYASSEDKLCTDESSFVIDYEDCAIPRGISPNNDGLNDVFDLTPHGVESIKIYNRWGTEVYSHGAGYTTQWHGQSKNGKQLPDGTYYYVIIAHGKTRTGWVQINK